MNPTLALQVFGGSAHSNIAIECGFRGPGTTNSNSCASGVIAVGEAMRYIRDGMADVMIAGGAEAPLCPLTFGAFDFIKTMSRWKGEPAAFACRPFDLERDGFVMGEGACSLVIEEYEHALRRGAHIYAEVLGYALEQRGVSHDHAAAGRRSRHRLHARRARRRAPRARQNRLHQRPRQQHAAQRRQRSACASRAVFGAHAAARVSGTKAFTAHPLGATGAMETAICALALRDQWIPPTLHHRTPDPACDLDIVPNVGRAHAFRMR